MSNWDDLDDVTPRISNEDAERMLSGASGIDETHDLADLNAVLGALRGPAEAAELTGLQSVLVAFGAAAVTPIDLSTPRTRPMMKKLLTGKALAAIGVITLASAGAAAAAGVVPTPFSAPRPSVAKPVDADDQTDETVSDEASATPTTAEADETTEIDATETDAAQGALDVADSTDGQGPDVNGPAKFGLCTAYAARTKHDTTTTTAVGGATPAAEPVSDLPVPFQSLSDAADAAGQTVADFCADAVPGGADHADAKAGDNPSATAPGKAGDNPSVTAPGKSDDNPSVTAPGKSNDNPSATAPGESGETHGKP